MHQSIPAYIVFTDATLIDIRRIKTNMPDKFMENSGVGQAKSQCYGEIFFATMWNLYRTYNKPLIQSPAGGARGQRLVICRSLKY